MNLPEYLGISSKLLESFYIFWNILKYLGIFRIYWNILVSSGFFQNLLESSILFYPQLPDKLLLHVFTFRPSGGRKVKKRSCLSSSVCLSVCCRPQNILWLYGKSSSHFSYLFHNFFFNFFIFYFFLEMGNSGKLIACDTSFISISVA